MGGSLWLVSSNIVAGTGHIAVARNYVEMGVVVV
jgi:hypothetical protein